MSGLPTPNVDPNKKNSEVDDSDPFVQLLKDTAFVAYDSLAKPDNVVEYQVLKAINDKGSMTTDEIETEISNPLAPVAVKNLTEAELVTQTGDQINLSSKSKKTIG